MADIDESSGEKQKCTCKLLIAADLDTTWLVTNYMFPNVCKQADIFLLIFISFLHDNYCVISFYLNSSHET